MNTSTPFATLGIISSVEVMIVSVLIPLAIIGGIILLVRYVTRSKHPSAPVSPVPRQTGNKSKLQIVGWLLAATILALGMIGGAWIAKQKRLAAAAPTVIVTEYEWQKVHATGKLLGGTPVQIDGRTALKIENTNTSPLQVSILRMDEPPLTGTNYWLTGDVKYEGVRGDAYLEMWNHFKPSEPGFPPGEYFSRTLDYSGPLGRLTGTSDWRTFSLPFYSDEKSGTPTRLEFNLFLPGPGVVYIGPVKLMERSRPVGQN